MEKYNCKNIEYNENIKYIIENEYHRCFNCGNIAFDAHDITARVFCDNICLNEYHFKKGIF